MFGVLFDAFVSAVRRLLCAVCCAMFVVGWLFFLGGGLSVLCVVCGSMCVVYCVGWYLMCVVRCLWFVDCSLSVGV